MNYKIMLRKKYAELSVGYYKQLFNNDVSNSYIANRRGFVQIIPPSVISL